MKAIEYVAYTFIACLCFAVGWMSHALHGRQTNESGQYVYKLVLNDAGDKVEWKLIEPGDEWGHR